MRFAALSCLLIALAATASASSDAKAAEAGAVGSKCPVAGKCPYYEHAKELAAAKEAEGGEGAAATHHGCPLHEKGCPYYDKHKKDHGIEDVVTSEDHECPLKDKCSFYKDVKEGRASKVDWKAHKCPLGHKCPYYEELVKNGSAKGVDCPVLHACPHFKKEDIEGQPHPEGYAHGHKHNAEECPFLKKKKAQEAAATASTGAEEGEREKDEL
ncbi:hypothetical protein HK104_002172 [Borealophlyctis nickersoniae]|nr:hypothetical protein HK104_002172 [Borealophlyctis nickersoniae]